jgi:hypothetical protein
MRAFSFLVSSILFLVFALCLYASINTGVSLKYEVDESQIAVGMNDKLSQPQKENRLSELGKRGWYLKTQIAVLRVGSALSIISIVLINIRKKRV